MRSRDMLDNARLTIVWVDCHLNQTVMYVALYAGIAEFAVNSREGTMATVQVCNAYNRYSHEELTVLVGH